MNRNYQLIRSDQIPPEKPTPNRMAEDGLTLAGGGYPYHIDASRLDTCWKVLNWLAHLTEKDWFSARDARDVITYAWHYCGVNPHGEHA